MTGRYRFREDVVAADVAMEVEGDSLADLLEAAALAVENTMVEDLATVMPQQTREVRLEASSPEDLLFEFLQELIYLKDAELFMAGRVHCEVREKAGGIALRATLEGETLDAKRHEQLVDVKAVTYHMYRVEQKDGIWRAFVVLDV